MILIKKLKREFKRPFNQFLNLLVSCKRFCGFYDRICISDSFFVVSPHEFWREFKKDGWEPDTFNCFKAHLSRDVTFIDIGAWVGLCSMWATVIGCKKIYAVEANPRSYKFLKKTIDANKDLKDLVSLSNRCISDVNGTTVRFGRKLSSNSMISSEGHYSVITTTLSSYVNHIGVCDNLFLKIDIEGAEELILNEFISLGKSIKKLKIFLALHPPFWKNKESTCLKLLKICKNFQITLSDGSSISESRLQEMILTEDNFPEWGTPYGNLFEILLSK